MNANASNPHYEPKQDVMLGDPRGDVVLIDMWAKLDQAGRGLLRHHLDRLSAARSRQTAMERVFNVVREARDRAIQCVAGRGRREASNCADSKWTMPRASFIREQGFAEYFFHRTGHSIGTDVHGTGANMDNLETHDERKVIPWTCFSIEPGIYLPEFGVRSEVNVFVDEQSARVTGEKQESIVLI